MTRSHLTILVTAIGLAIAAPLAAQQPNVRFQVTPSIGGGLMLSDLPSSYRLTADGSTLTELDGGVLDDALALGLTGGVRIGDRFGIEADLRYLPTTVNAYSAGSRTVSDANVFLLGGNLSLFLPVGSGRIEPFLTAGAGAKVYDPDYEGADTESDFAVNFGGGANLRLTPAVALRVDVRDYVSSLDPDMSGLDSEIQHDLLLSTGLTFTLPTMGARHGRR